MAVRCKDQVKAGRQGRHLAHFCTAGAADGKMKIGVGEHVALCVTEGKGDMSQMETAWTDVSDSVSS